MSQPTSPLTEPGIRENESTTLGEFLDYFRAVLRRKAEGLSAEQLNTPLAPSDMTIGGMLKHLTYVEIWWFGEIFLGIDPPPPWNTVDWEADNDWDWHSAVHDTPEQLLTAYDDACAASREVAAAASGLDQESVAESRRHGGHFTLRWIMVHMIEEYARHCGHADLIRESIDGETGD